MNLKQKKENDMHNIQNNIIIVQKKQCCMFLFKI